MSECQSRFTDVVFVALFACLTASASGIGLSEASAREASPSCPPASSSAFAMFPQHCIGKVATGQSCSPPLHTGVCEMAANTSDISACVKEALTACVANPNCHAFALRAGGASCSNFLGDKSKLEWHLYTVSDGYPVNNSDWIVYSQHVSPTPPPPPTPESLEHQMTCGVRNAAVEFAVSRIGQSFGTDRTSELVSNALRLHTDCPTASTIQRRDVSPSPEDPSGVKTTKGTAINIYISPSGNDISGDGTNENPYQSPIRARDAVRSFRQPNGYDAPATIIVESGVYHLGDLGKLVLDHRDGNTAWLARVPGNTTFSGTTRFSDLKWTKNTSHIYAAVVPTNDFSVLFESTDDMLVRSRFPNGNPINTSGLCFRGGMLESEGCAAYMKPVGTVPGTEFVGTTVKSIQFNTTRGGVVAGDDIYRQYNVIYQEPPINLKLEGYPSAVCNQGEGGGELYNRSGSVVWSAEYDFMLNHSDTWTYPNEMVVHMMHNGWGNVFYSVKSFHPENRTILFERGGYQHGRSGDVSNFYIDNVFEALDSPAEWWYDSKASVLYLWPNGTAPPTELYGAVLETVVHVNGTDQNVVTNLSFSGITFGQTSTSFLKPYERPISGDWAIRRSGTIIIEGAEGVTLSTCKISQTGGNGVLFSRHVKTSSIIESEFHYIGDSAVVAFGDIDWLTGDARGGRYPSKLNIDGNLIHEIGIWGKQVSAFFQGVSGNNKFTNNVAFNGPRAMVNINDGMLGLSNISGNLLFNGCRESDDHGNFNSWDRTPMLHYVDDDSGEESWTPSMSTVSGNLIINSYGAGHGIDHDDGSMMYNDVENVIAFSHACKGNYGSDRNCSANIILAPGLKSVYNPKAGGGGVCAMESNNGRGSTFANKYFERNLCVHIWDEPDAYDFASCQISKADQINASVWHTSQNTFLSPSGQISIRCGKTLSFSEWQSQLGEDQNSAVGLLPPIESLMKNVSALLHIF